MTEDQVRQYIYQQLDLSGVADCLAKPPASMDAAAATDAAARYRDFLWVCWYHWSHGGGDSLAAVDEDADEAWHCHMLQPVRYRDACAVIFGGQSLLDHRPGGDLTRGGTPDAPAIAAACQAYRDAGVNPPQPPRSNCVWAVVA
jgi:hypothetical protein